MFKLIIAGGREFKKSSATFQHIDKLLSKQFKGIEIVSGGARGADAVGEEYALSRNLQVKLFEAEWDTYGKSAGYRRNAEMAAYADGLLAYWDGESKGTKHMIDLARAKDLKVIIVKY